MTGMDGDDYTYDKPPQTFDQRAMALLKGLRTTVERNQQFVDNIGELHRQHLEIVEAKTQQALGIANATALELLNVSERLARLEVLLKPIGGGDDQ